MHSITPPPISIHLAYYENIISHFTVLDAFLFAFFVVYLCFMYRRVLFTFLTCYLPVLFIDAFLPHLPVIDLRLFILHSSPANTLQTDSTSGRSTPAPMYSPTPPFCEDPYSDFGRFPYKPGFVGTYISILPKSKRIFTTGKVLEDTIFHSVRPTPADSEWLEGNPILKWVLDLDDIEVKNWFTAEEKTELVSWGAPLPPRDEYFEYAVGRFPKVVPTSPPCLRHINARQIPSSFGELWDIIESRSRPEGEPFDETRHSTAIYSTNATSTMFVPPPPLFHSHR